MKASTEFCFVCLLHLKYNVFQKGYPVQGYCKHLVKKYSGPGYYKISKFCCFICIVLTIPQLLVLSVQSFSLPEICQKTKSLCLIFISDQVFCVCSFLLFFSTFLNLKIYEKEINAWLFLFENSYLFNLNEVFSKKQIKLVQLRRITIFSVFVFLCTLMGVFVFCFPYDNLPWNFLRKFAVLHCFLLQCYGTFDALQRMKLIGHLLRAFEKSIKSTLTNKLLDQVEMISFRTALKKYRNFICVLNMNINLLMKYLALTCTIFTLSSIISLIINIYISIKYFDYDALSLGTLELRTLATIWSNLYIAVQVETNINRKVSL